MRLNVQIWRQVSAAGFVGLLTFAIATPAAGQAQLDGPDSGAYQLYVTNSALRSNQPTANIGRFTVDAAGLPQPAGVVPVGQGARGIVFTHGGQQGQQFAFVPCQTAGEIDRYLVAADGSLTLLGSTAAPGPFGIAMDPPGHTVYVTNNNGGNSLLSAYRIENTGELTLLNSVETGGVNPKGVLVTHDGRFAYVTHGGPGIWPSAVLMGFALNPDGSVGGMVSQTTIGISGHKVVTTPDGRFIYVTDLEDGAVGDVYGFGVGPQGALTPLFTQPVEAGVWVEGAAVSPDGQLLFTTALGVIGKKNNPVADGQVRTFAIGEDGNLTQIAQIDIGFDPVDLAVSPDGEHLYVADFSGHSLITLAVDGTGALTPVGTVDSQGLDPASHGVTMLAG